LHLQAVNSHRGGGHGIGATQIVKMLEKEKREYLFHVKKPLIVEETGPADVVLPKESFLDTIFKSIGCFPTVNEVDDRGGGSHTNSMKLGSPEQREEFGSPRSSTDSKTDHRNDERLGRIRTRTSQVGKRQSSRAFLDKKSPVDGSDVITMPESSTSVAKAQNVLIDDSKSIVLNALEVPEEKQPFKSEIDKERRSPSVAAMAIASSFPIQIEGYSEESMTTGPEMKSRGVISETSHDESRSARDTFHWLTKCGDNFLVTAEETTLFVPRSRITRTLFQTKSSEAIEDEYPQFLLPELAHNTFQDSSSTAAVTKPVELSRNLSKPAELPELASTALQSNNSDGSLREQSNSLAPGWTTKEVNPSPSPPVKPSIQTNASRSCSSTKQIFNVRSSSPTKSKIQTNGSRSNLTTKQAFNSRTSSPVKPRVSMTAIRSNATTKHTLNSSISSPAKQRIPITASKSRPTTKPKSNSSNSIARMKPNSLDRGILKLPDRIEGQGILPPSRAETVKVSNVHVMDERDGVGVEEADLVLNNPRPTTQELASGFGVPLGLDPDIRIDRGRSLVSPTAIARNNLSTPRKAAIARSECMELLLAPSLEGVAIGKRTISMKKRRSLQKRSSGRRSPSRNAAYRVIN
jgi:hypothetical protein